MIKFFANPLLRCGWYLRWLCSRRAGHFLQPSLCLLVMVNLPHRAIFFGLPPTRYLVLKMRVRYAFVFLGFLA